VEAAAVRKAMRGRTARTSASIDEAAFEFWPGGSRALDAEGPSRGYTIVGSWSSWSKPEDMRWEGNGVYGYTLTLGENRYEHFQIWLDGEPAKILHPSMQHAPNGSAAFLTISAGADNDEEHSSSFSWQLDGRDCILEKIDSVSGQRVSLRLVDPHTGRPLSRQDEGRPGDRYLIRLHVAGKYHMVDWEKLSSQPVVKLDDVVIPSTAKYYVVGNWASWRFQEMVSDASCPGVFHAEVVLAEDGGEFQIVRDQDWNQVFSPSDVEGEVSGPSTASDWHWELHGIAGESFRIEFERQYIRGVDTLKISWRKTPRIE